MRIYETIYICPPDLDEEKLEDFSDLVREIIYDNGGKIIKQEKWGKRHLAYEIKHHKDGIYYYFLYGGSGDTVKELERRMRIAEECIRFLTVRLDKELKGKKHKIYTKEELRLALQMEPDKKSDKLEKPKSSAVAVDETVEKVVDEKAAEISAPEAEAMDVSNEENQLPAGDVEAKPEEVTPVAEESEEVSEPEEEKEIPDKEAEPEKDKAEKPAPSDESPSEESLKEEDSKEEEKEEK